MTEAISMDLRKRIVAAHRRGAGTYDQLAERFDVGRATVSRLLRRARERRDIGRDPPGGGNPPRIARDEYPALAALVREMESATRRELADAWKERFGVSISEAAMGRTLRAAGFTRKKRGFALKSSSALTSSRRGKRSRDG